MGYELKVYHWRRGTPSIDLSHSCVNSNDSSRTAGVGGSTDVGVRGDDGSAGKVDPLAHHVLPKKALLLLQLLADSLRVCPAQSNGSSCTSPEG